MANKWVKTTDTVKLCNNKYFNLKTYIVLTFVLGNKRVIWSIASYKYQTLINFNPFLANMPILYPQKTPENLPFASVFRGYKMGTLARYGLMKPWEAKS